MLLALAHTHQPPSGWDIFAALVPAGHGYPAAGFLAAAALHGAQTFEFNLERSLVHSAFDEGFYGPATETVTKWVEAIL